MPVSEGFNRKIQNKEEWNRLDAYDEAFHERVRQGYLELAQHEPDRWVVIDATQKKEKVQEDMRQVILDKLARS